MSNQQVGAVYHQIIQDVVDSSRVDFEEGGVDEQVLEELKLGWQQKLSQLQIATFPWDPKLEPPAANPPDFNPPTVASNVANYQANAPSASGSLPQGGNVLLANQMAQSAGNDIKQEPGAENTASSNVGQPPPQPPLISGTPAAQRAASLLQANYGQRAAASINAIQSNAPQPGQAPPTTQQIHAHQQALHQQQKQMQHHLEQHQQQRVNGMQPQQGAPMTQEQYKQAMIMHAQNQQRLQSQNGVSSSQLDGADDDFEGPVAILKSLRGNTDQELGRLQVDAFIREQIAATGVEMEGGGLMLPLRILKKPRRSRRTTKSYSSKLLAQLDGPGSDDDDDDDEDTKDNIKDDDLDEDAINSDLDDPNDGLDEEEDDDEGMGHIMLCMYDKVQRVKNKWKCVMKDGVLTVNGKEYVFHKASGEYEW